MAAHNNDTSPIELAFKAYAFLEESKKHRTPENEQIRKTNLKESTKLLVRLVSLSPEKIKSKDIILNKLSQLNPGCCRTCGYPGMHPQDHVCEIDSKDFVIYVSTPSDYDVLEKHFKKENLEKWCQQNSFSTGLQHAEMLVENDRLSEATVNSIEEYINGNQSTDNAKIVISSIISFAEFSYKLVNIVSKTTYEQNIKQLTDILQFMELLKIRHSLH